MGRCYNNTTCHSCSKEEGTRGLDDIRALLDEYYNSTDKSRRHKRHSDVKHANTKPTTNSLQDKKDLLCVECCQKELASRLGYPLMSAGSSYNNPMCAYYEGKSGWQPSPRYIPTCVPTPTTLDANNRGDRIDESPYNCGRRGHGNLGGWTSQSNIFDNGRATNNPRGIFTGLEGLERSRPSGLRLGEIGNRQMAPAMPSMGELWRLRGAFPGRFGSR